MNLGIRTIALLLFLITAILLFILVIQCIRYFFRKITFPKKLALITSTGFLVLLAIFVYIQYFFTFALIGKEHMQIGAGPVLSPSENYAAQVYYEPYGGVLGGVNVWVEVTDNEKQTTKIVYYADAKNQVTLQWIDETSLFINNEDQTYTDSNRSIQLNIEREIYHENGLACQSLLLRNSFETCYQYKD
ncbi:DUF5412 family protein [Solibacillus daqui]|uniref:DUF5412 family protein n=1 Tax=Solibacillus daqui TaxID=2912187 RepID=UPI0023663185|nr:DUF5412 family protein [Solibacillus daqui]